MGSNAALEKEEGHDIRNCIKRASHVFLIAQHKLRKSKAGKVCKCMLSCGLRYPATAEGTPTLCGGRTSFGVQNPERNLKSKNKKKERKEKKKEEEEAISLCREPALSSACLSRVFLLLFVFFSFVETDPKFWPGIVFPLQSAAMRFCGPRLKKKNPQKKNKKPHSRGNP
ncbi:LANO_0C01002g1_1 [Lachancea nothofagi CBS 11611]|uniref:LANO_0C01002g1_1 n=1 Tax=Lachancea nothofagi CBS 11611 TaxID=1266666 RepID=A0A1G4J3X1_9SACH|nr:LANO_0C01002g1_1 [Lachancea nothofagi CBS 11611]